MISLILITLNDQHNIKHCLNSLKKSKNYELIIIDGNSNDQTVKLSKQYTKKVFISSPGMHKQTLLGLTKAKYENVILLEADHIYPKNFVQTFYNEFKKSKKDIVQAKIDYISKSNNFFKEGYKIFLKIHNLRNANKDKLIATTCIAKKKIFHEIMKKLKNKKISGFGFDTSRAEIVKSMNLNVGLVDIFVNEIQEIDINKFIQRVKNYGNGDYEFFKKNSKDWKFLRKIKSIFHIFLRYFIIYPLKSFRHNPFVGIPYFLLIGILRYFFWFKNFFKSKGN